MYIDIAYQRYKELNCNSNKKISRKQYKLFDIELFCDVLNEKTDCEDSDFLDFMSIFCGNTIYHNSVNCYAFAKNAFAENGFGYYVKIVQDKAWRVFYKTLSLISLSFYDVSYMAKVFCNVLNRMFNENQYIYREINEFNFECEQKEYTQQIHVWTKYLQSIAEFEDIFNITYQMIVDDIYQEDTELVATAGSNGFDKTEYISFKLDYVKYKFDEGKAILLNCQLRAKLWFDFYNKVADKNIDELSSIVAARCCADSVSIAAYIKNKEKLATNYFSLLSSVNNSLMSPFITKSLNVDINTKMFSIYKELFLFYCNAADKKMICAYNMLNGKIKDFYICSSYVYDLAISNKYLIVRYVDSVDIITLKIVNGDIRTAGVYNERLSAIGGGVNFHFNIFGKFLIAKTLNDEWLCGIIRKKSINFTKSMSNIIKANKRYNWIGFNNKKYVLFIQSLPNNQNKNFMYLEANADDTNITYKSPAISNEQHIIKLAHNFEIVALFYYDSVIYSASKDGVIRAWDIQNKKRLYTIDSGKSIIDLRVSKRFIIALTKTGEFLFYDRNGDLTLAKGAWGQKWLINLMPLSKRMVIELFSKKTIYKQ